MAVILPGANVPLISTIQEKDGTLRKIDPVWYQKLKDLTTSVNNGTGGGGSGGGGGSTLVRATGSVTPRSLADRFADILNIKDFGAKGDGITDDHVAIQAAVNQCLQTGGRLFIPPSPTDYICNSTVVIDPLASGVDRYGGAINIFGCGPRFSCIRSNTIATALFRYVGTLATDESHFRMEQLKLTGNAFAPITNSVGLDLSSGAWMTFCGVDIEGFDLGVTAVDIDQISWTDCNICFNRRGLFADVATFTSANSWMFINCLLRANETYGMWMKTPNAFSFIGGSVQGNGRIGGANNWGIFLEEAGNGYGTALFEAMVFESNGGDADLISTQAVNQCAMLLNNVGFLRSVPQITAITGAVDNGFGLIRITTPTAPYTTGQVLAVLGVGGVPNAIGQWTITVIDANHLDLQGSAFAGAYTTGGIATYYGYCTNNVLINGTNAASSYAIKSCTFKTLAPYVPSAARLVVAVSNPNCVVIDDGSNYYQNAVETHPTAVVQGAITVNNAGKGIGYGPGTGGSFVQATSKTTTVTANTSCGQIIMNAASLAANSTVNFVVTNSTVAATDLIHISHVAGGVNFASYIINARPNGAGSFAVDVRNSTAGALAEAIVLGFAVIKATTS